MLIVSVFVISMTVSMYVLIDMLQAVEGQFSADYDLTVKKRMKFQVTSRGADPAIKIKFERNLPGGWSIERESMGKEVRYIDFKVLLVVTK